MKGITIYRGSWLHSEGDSDSMLLRPSDNKMCCLGQLGYQCGIPLDSMTERLSLAEFSLIDYASNFPELVFVKIYGNPALNQCPTNTSLAISAMSENDGRIADYDDNGKPIIEVKSQPEQEASITTILSQAGFNVIFVDGIAPWFDEE